MANAPGNGDAYRAVPSLSSTNTLGGTSFSEDINGRSRNQRQDPVFCLLSRGPLLTSLLFIRKLSPCIARTSQWAANGLLRVACNDRNVQQWQELCHNKKDYIFTIFFPWKIGLDSVWIDLKCLVKRLTLSLWQSAPPERRHWTGLCQKLIESFSGYFCSSILTLNPFWLRW